VIALAGLSNRRRPVSANRLRALQQRWARPEAVARSTPRPLPRQQWRPQSSSARGTMRTVQGWVVSVRPDSHNQQTGTHEIFFIATGGRTVMVANNVEVGKRVSPTVGSQIEVRGEYVPASIEHPDDFIHYTHRSRSGREHGWILYRGRKYD